MTIWPMRLACRISNFTVTHLEYVIITAFPLQQWLHERPQCYVMHTLPVLFHLLSTSQSNCRSDNSGHACCYAIMNPSSTKRCASIRYRCRCCQYQRDLYWSFLLVRTDLISSAWETLLIAQLPPAFNGSIRISQICSSRISHILVFLVHVLQLKIFLLVLLQIREGN